MGFELTGTIKVIMDTQTFNSGFSKREFVVTSEDGKFPQDICFECVKDKISLLDSFSAGSKVTVSFDIRGREYNGRYFNNLNAWKITAGAQAQGGGAAPSAQSSASTPNEYENPAFDEGREGGFEDPF